MSCFTSQDQPLALAAPTRRPPPDLPRETSTLTIHPSVAGTLSGVSNAAVDALLDRAGGRRGRKTASARAVQVCPTPHAVCARHPLCKHASSMFACRFAQRNVSAAPLHLMWAGLVIANTTKGWLRFRIISGQGGAVAVSATEREHRPDAADAAQRPLPGNGDLGGASGAFEEEDLFAAAAEAVHSDDEAAAAVAAEAVEAAAAAQQWQVRLSK